MAQVQEVTKDSTILEPSRHDAAAQRVTTQVITFDERVIHMRPVAIRYSWSAELDLMAGRAGLKPRER